MLLTKFTHSCVRLEKDEARLVFDPGVFSEVDEALDGAHHVVVTHIHPDHYDAERLAAALRADAALEVHAPAAVIDALAEAAPEATGRLHPVTAGTRFAVGPFELKTYGGQHALIHPLIPTVANVGFVIDDAVYHPGDSFAVPPGPAVPTVLVPLHAPWSKISEVIDFVVATRAERAYQIHDALLSEAGLGIVENQVSRFARDYGTDYQHLTPGQCVEV